MPSIFDSKYFNAEVFGRYLETVPRVRQNAFLSAGILRTRTDLKTQFSAQTGGNYISIPMTGLIGGEPLNYDGTTNVTSDTIDSYIQSMIVVGRMKAWKEKDFTFDITGKNFMEEIAKQVVAYWDDIDQATIIAELQCIFGVSTDKFNVRHTHDISDTSSPYVGPTTLNTAIQKAAGANKNIFTMAVMHSTVATNLENLEILEYRKQSDSEGVQRSIALADWNGRTVLVDDDVPTVDGYFAATESTPGALKIVASGATGAQVNLATVTAAAFHPADAAANQYVVEGTKYTTYVLGQGAFDYCDCGVKEPNEPYRDPKTNGGIDELITRQRKLFAPRGFSFVQPSPAIISPTDAQLKTAARWSIVKNTDGSKYFDTKAIPFVQIISRG